MFVPERHCRDTATRFARSYRPASFRELGRGCGEVVNKSVVSPPRQPQTTRHMSVSPLSFLAMAVDKTQQALEPTQPEK